MGHPSLDLAKKTAVVIGGTSGIGVAIAKGLALAGANVVPAGRRVELVQSVSKEIQGLGVKSFAQAADVTDRSSLQSLHDSVLKNFGSVQILVNCAGRTKRAPTLSVSESERSGIM